MQRWLKLVLANVLFVVITVALLGTAGYYWYERNRYISTNDARLSANIINISATEPGRITKWQVRPGDSISSGQAVGNITTITSPAMSDPGPEQTGALPVQTQSGVTGQAPGAAGTQPAPAAQPQTNAAPAPSSPGGVSSDGAEVKAPINGTVIQSLAQVGQTVSPGQVLAMVSDLSKISVTANIDETQVKDVKRGNDVNVSVDAYPGDVFKGKVTAIVKATASTFSPIPVGSPAGSYTRVVQKIPVQIEITDTMGRSLLPGMNASVRISK